MTAVTTPHSEAPDGADRIHPRRPGYTREGIPSGLKQSIRRRDDETCHYCKRRGTESGDPDGNSWHIDHKHPVSRGGDNSPSNLVLACRACNLDKSDTPYEEYRPTDRQPVLVAESWRLRARRALRLVVLESSDPSIVVDASGVHWRTQDCKIFDPVSPRLDNCHVNSDPGQTTAIVAELLDLVRSAANVIDLLAHGNFDLQLAELIEELREIEAL